ncbi:hypothetical protein EV426DRAFT_661134 [Tirmania nivea]|nr:hypothetical protein EV426DRAFT_661134 [Tirmania nivea]
MSHPNSEEKTYKAWSKEEVEKLIGWMEENQEALRGLQRKWHKDVKEEVFADDENITVNYTDLGTDALGMFSSTAYIRERLEEVQNFLTDFEMAFNNGLQFDSSLKGHDDPNIINTRIWLRQSSRGRSDRFHPYHKRAPPCSERRKLTLGACRANFTPDTCEARVTKEGFCDTYYKTSSSRNPSERITQCTLLRVPPVPTSPGKHQSQLPTMDSDYVATLPCIGIDESNHGAY